MMRAVEAERAPLLAEKAWPAIRTCHWAERGQERGQDARGWQRPDRSVSMTSEEWISDPPPASAPAGACSCSIASVLSNADYVPSDA